VCGILGLLLHNSDGDAAPEICEGLSLLQHRGQDACGIVTCGAKGRFFQCKANGMVRDVFDAKSLSTLPGGMGIGHGRSWMFFLYQWRSHGYVNVVRYPTAGSSAYAEAQPFYVNSPYGIVFAHVRSNLPHHGYASDQSKLSSRTEISLTRRNSRHSWTPMPTDISTPIAIQSYFSTSLQIICRKLGNSVLMKKTSSLRLAI
jgi:glutamine phosphoribosylpyrophosphate amidotransferase